MDAFEAMRKRRSVRSFKGDPVPREALEEMLDCARWAPSAANEQMWQFVVVTSRERIARLAALVEEKLGRMREKVTSPRARDRFDGYTSYFSHFGGAPALVVVCARPYDTIYARLLKRYLPDEPRPQLVEPAAMSVAAAIENMLVAAEARGLGACFMTGPTVAQEALESELGVEDPWHVVALVPVGCPADEPKPRERKPLSEIARCE